jgi:hypothetical protein
MKNLLLFLGIALLVPSLKAQTIETNSNSVVIEMIPNTRKLVEKATFYISKHAISPQAYCAHLNAVDRVAGRLYHPEWGNLGANTDLLTIAQTRDEDSGLYSYSLINGATNILATTTNGVPIVDPTTGKPKYKIIPERTIMKGVPMADAARFCNWLAKNQPIEFIGNEATENESYTIIETRERQPNDSFTTKTMYDPKYPNSNKLKNVYMSVNRNPGATWRLPTRQELATVLDPSNWGSLDGDNKLWYWTEDSYIMDFPPSMRNPYHTPYDCNTGGYYRVKNGSSSGLESPMTYHKFQNEFVNDTGFFVVFSADKVPASGFKICVPSAAAPTASTLPSSRSDTTTPTPSTLVQP